MFEQCGEISILLAYSRVYTSIELTEDFDAPSPSTIIFPAGAGGGPLECSMVEIRDDFILELNETITILLTLVSPTDACVNITQNTTIITIVDDEGKEKHEDCSNCCKFA